MRDFLERKLDRKERSRRERERERGGKESGWGASGWMCACVDVCVRSETRQKLFHVIHPTVIRYQQQQQTGDQSERR